MEILEPAATLPLPSEGNSAASAASAAAMEAAATARKTRSDKGKPRGPRAQGQDSSGYTPVGGDATMSPELRAEITRQVEALYNPKAWGALLAAPADMLLATTGKKRWDIGEEERATLGACGSTAARCMMIQNPKTLAFLMLGAAISSVYGTRLVQELREYAAEKRKAQNVAASQAAASSDQR